MDIDREILHMKLESIAELNVPFIPFIESVSLWHENADKWLARLRARPESTRAIPPVTRDENTGVMVIVEPRDHPHLELVLRMFVHFLAHKGWALLIVHGTSNEERVREITRGWESVSLLNLGVPNLAIDQYNAVMTSAAFWNIMPHDNVLIFQTDTILFSGEGLDRFLEYDYVGAPWYGACPMCFTIHESGGRVCGHLKGQSALHAMAPQLVGNGGLSFRKRSAMLRVLDRFVFGKTPASDEDVFFSLALKELGGRVPSMHDAETFSIEELQPRTFPRDASPAVGGHKFWAYLHPRVCERLFKYVQI